MTARAGGGETVKERPCPSPKCGNVQRPYRHDPLRWWFCESCAHTERMTEQPPAPTSGPALGGE